MRGFEDRDLRATVAGDGRLLAEFSAVFEAVCLDDQVTGGWEAERAEIVEGDVPTITRHKLVERCQIRV